jgi:pimeloyl-ACP methyl ester carboxylesterase
MTYDPSAEIPVRTGTFRAVVRAGNTVTSYERSGAGHPVLLLVGPDAEIATPFWLAIRKAIGAQFRLVVPDPTPSVSDLGEWLGGFLDGLGVEGASLVADERVGVAVIGFALLAPDRVSRLVLVSSNCPDVPNLDGAVGDRATSHPLLVVRAQGDPEVVAESVVRFLAGGSGT